MEDKKRTLLAVAISCIILLAVGYSFGVILTADPPEIVVADPGAASEASGAPAASDGQGGLPVAVTPETVGSVIAHLSRFRSYSRTLTVTYAGDWGTGTVTARIMVDNGWSRCDTTVPGGIVERSITGDGTLWYWYGDGEDYLTADASLQTEDLMQRVPTYEDILALDPGEITEAGYEEKDGVPAIYVEARSGLSGCLERYWVSVDSGLLVAAETEKDGAVVYAAASSDMVSPLTGAEGAFTLPDGTVLHEVAA